MGTNVVRLTDRKYMQELRKRIQDDYNATLQKRISQREVVVSFSFYMSFKAYIFNDCIILGLCLFEVL